MSDASVVYSRNRAYEHYQDLSQGATNAVSSDRRIFDDFSDTQSVGHRRRKQEYSAISRGIMLSALLIIIGGFVVFIAFAFLGASLGAAVAAIIIVLGLVLLRFGMVQMERDRSIAA